MDGVASWQIFFVSKIFSVADNTIQTFLRLTSPLRVVLCDTRPVAVCRFGFFIFTRFVEQTYTRTAVMVSQDSGKRSPRASQSTKRIQDLQAAAAEAVRTAMGQPTNLLGPVSTLDTLTYRLENNIAANPNYPFQL